MVYKATNRTGGPHPVVIAVQHHEKGMRLGFFPDFQLVLKMTWVIVMWVMIGAEQESTSKTSSKAGPLILSQFWAILI